MKKMVKKKILKKAIKPIGILPVLLIITLLALFSETVRTLPVGALISENFFNLPYEVPKLNSEIIEKKLIRDLQKINKQYKNENTIEEEIIVANTYEKEKEIEKVQIEINEIQSKTLDQKIIVAKVSEKEIEKSNPKT